MCCELINRTLKSVELSIYNQWFIVASYKFRIIVQQNFY